MDRRVFNLAMLAFSGLGGAARAQEPAPTPAAPLTADEALPSILAETKAAGLAGAVITPDGMSWIKAAGRRRADVAVAVTTGDRWHLGSNTKAMTAAVYARLVEKKRAKWGATVRELFPDLRVDPAWNAITIEALLSHTAGISDPKLIDRAWLMASHSDPRPITEQRRTLAARAFGAAPTGKPGAFEYANAGYILAGAAIEKITGAPWEDAVRSEVFSPLAMRSAGFGAPQGSNAWGHTAAGVPVDPSGIADNPSALGPAGTVHATLEDYAKFLRVFLADGAGSWLTPDSVSRLTRAALPGDRGYALGWITFQSRRWARGPVLAHEGSNTLWHVLCAVAPLRRIALVTVSNDETRGARAVQKLGQKLIEQFAPA